MSLIDFKIEQKLAEVKQAREQLQVYRDMGATWTEYLIPGYDQVIEELERLRQEKPK